MTQKHLSQKIDMGYQKTQNSILIQNLLKWTVKNVPEISYRQKNYANFELFGFCSFSSFLLIPVFGTISWTHINEFGISIKCLIYFYFIFLGEELIANFQCRCSKTEYFQTFKSKTYFLQISISLSFNPENWRPIIYCRHIQETAETPNP